MKRREDVDDALGRDGAGDDLTHRVVQFLIGTHLAGGALGQRRANGLEERHVVANAGRLLVRDSEGERLLQLAHDADEALLAVLLRQDVLLGYGQQLQPLGRAAGPCRPVEAVEQAAADLVLLLHQRDRPRPGRRRSAPSRRSLVYVARACFSSFASPR